MGTVKSFQLLVRMRVADNEGLSRRQLLKRGAIVGGGLLWATPAVQTIGMSRALAQVTSPGEPPTDGFGNCGGSVVDATNATGIPGALVSVVGTGLSTTTDQDGNFLINNIPAGPRTFEVSATGYNTSTTPVTVIAGETGDKVFALSPISASEVTAVLTWGAVPTDLDLHASGPDGGGGRFHAYWVDKTPVAHVELDIDDVSSFGPETMAFKIVPGPGGSFVAGTYRVWVHDWTNRATSSLPQWGASNAQVVFTGLAGQIAVYLVSTAVSNEGPIVEDDKLWRVFQFDLAADGTISNIVVFENFTSGDASTPDV
jgi:uncharacterized protein YfaP (DUF2135 family)